MNKIIVFSITFLLFGIQKVSAQNHLNYYETINKAEIANLDKNFRISDSIYRIAFKLTGNPFKEDYLLASINSEKLKDYQKTFEYLKKGISNGLTLKRINKKISKFKESKEWKTLQKEYNTLRENYLKTLNINLRNEITKMAELDQKARKPIFGSYKQMHKTDNDNYNRLIEIIKENGNKWPGFSVIGEISPNGKYDFDLIGTIAIMPLHFKTEQVKKLEPYMQEAVLNGDMYPYQYARIIDYRLKNMVVSVKSNKRVTKSELCTFYGTFTDEFICDCEKAEEARKKIGLEPLDDFYRKMKVSYDCYNKK